MKTLLTVIKFCFFSLTLLLCESLSAQDYAWPTEASRHLTSNFCEFRPRHFHAGIDIKTWNRTGFKIFAIEDGYVYRIRVSATGYGKAIYLKLKDGNIVVYAHLSGFTKELDAYSDQKRLANRKNILDHYPEPSEFPVKRGQYIGHTGETGIGVPHLHFEIRNRYHQPINPLQFYRDYIRDTIAPKSRQLAIIPRSADAMINFQPDTLVIPVVQATKTRVKEPIHVSGSAYIALRTFDMANEVTNKYDFYRSEMFFNDSLVYSVKYDRFNYDETRLLELDKTFSLWRKGRRGFHNYFRHPANSLPFYGDFQKNAGLLNASGLKYGKNEVTIRVYDYFDNMNEVIVPIVYHPSNPVAAFNRTIFPNRVFVGIKSDVPIHTFKVNQVNDRLSRSVSIADFEQTDRNKILDAHYYNLIIPKTNRRGLDWLQIIPYYDEETPALPVYAATDSSLREQPNSEAVSTTFYGKSVRLETGNQMGTQLAGENGDVASYEFRPGHSALIGSASGNQAELGKFLDAWRPVIPGREVTVRSNDRRLQVYFPSNSVYDSLHVRITRHSPQRKLRKPYRYLSDVYTVTPFDQPMDYGATIRFMLPDSIRNQKGVGIFYLDRRKGWLFLPTKKDKTSGARTARVTSLEKFVAIQDSIPPRVEVLNLQKFNAPGSRVPSLKFSAKDGMSGIYNERQISVRINNKWSLFTYDPEEDWIFIYERYIPKGQSTVQVSVTDNAGNKTVKEYKVIR